MARIVLAPDLFADFDRIADHLLGHGVADVAARLTDITDAFDILAHSPLIGRPVTRGTRELIIGQGARGYVALYRFLPDLDAVVVLAIRGQREAGYRRPD